MKNYNMILTEKQQKHRHYHQVRIDKYEYLTDEELSKLNMKKIMNMKNIIKYEQKNINGQIFREYFNYQSPSFLVSNLYEDNQNKNGRTVKYLNESSINSKEISKNESPKKKANIVEKILDFNKQE